MRLSLRLLSLAAAACLAPALAGRLDGTGWHNTLTWDALNDTGTLVLKSRYTEDGPRATVIQKVALQVVGAPPGATLQVQLNGRDLLPLTADSQGVASLWYGTSCARGSDGRPPAGRRIEEGDVVRVHGPGVDVAATYVFHYD